MPAQVDNSGVPVCVELASTESVRELEDSEDSGGIEIWKAM